jgi:hypothetical protein
VRRLSCALAAFLLIAPAALRLTASAVGADWEAVRCAIACGHAVKAGVVCCPMGSAEGATMTTCPPGESPAAAPMPAGTLAILTLTTPLAAPDGDSRSFTHSESVPLGPAARPPDHVPLLLS